ncbi:MAG: SpoIIE family protein phosphatase [Acidaminococcaceae bacterium]|nr:SpoIIE family protein phosphatase [Acidaminococcaceae bacterium]
MKFGKYNLNLHRKIFLVLLAVGLVTFAIAGAVTLAVMYAIQKNIAKTGNLLGDNIAAFTESFAENQVKLRLSSEADGKAKLIRLEMETSLEDTRYLAERMTQVLQNPQHFNRRSLPDPQRDVIPSGKAYVHFSRELRRQYGADAYASEIGLAANIADELELLNDWYTAAFVGSAHGYLIAVDVTPDKSAKKFSKAFLENYDPRKMGWYKLAENSKKPGYTSLYTDSNGQRCLTCVAPCYLNGELAGVAGTDCNMDLLFRPTEEEAAGDQDGNKPVHHRFLLDNATGNVIFSTFEKGALAVPQNPVDLRQSAEISIARAASAMADGKKDVMLVTVDGEDYYLAFAPVKSPGWSFGILNHKREVVYPASYARDNLLSQMEGFRDTIRDYFSYVMRWAVLAFILVLVILFFLSSSVAKRFVQPILRLVDGVKQIAQGNLDEKIELERDDELGYLADNVNDMAVDLKEHMQNLSKVTAEKERIATELSVATDIQEGMLPRNFGEVSRNKGFDLFASMNAAKEVGGDFYDFYMLDDHRLVITIADVSGKGVPAALFMVISKTILKNTALSEGAEADFTEVIRRANRQMCENNEEMLFVTVFFGVLDIRTGDFTYVNCGHNPPLLRQGAYGTFEYLRPAKKNLMLGIEEDLSFTQETLRLVPGSVLFCYTDGVTEAMDEAGNVYSENRLQTVLDGIPAVEDMPVADVLSSVRQDIKAHAGAAEQSDDITMLAVRYTG